VATKQRTHGKMSDTFRYNAYQLRRANSSLTVARACYMSVSRSAAKRIKNSAN